MLADAAQARDILVARASPNYCNVSFGNRHANGMTALSIAFAEQRNLRPVVIRVIYLASLPKREGAPRPFRILSDRAPRGISR